MWVPSWNPMESHVFFCTFFLYLLPVPFLFLLTWSILVVPSPTFNLYLICSFLPWSSCVVVCYVASLRRFDGNLSNTSYDLDGDETGIHVHNEAANTLALWSLTSAKTVQGCPCLEVYWATDPEEDQVVVAYITLSFTQIVTCASISHANTTSAPVNLWLSQWAPVVHPMKSRLNASGATARCSELLQPCDSSMSADDLAWNAKEYADPSSGLSS